MDESTQNPTLIGQFNNWWAHPFNPGGSAFNWVLFVGLVILAAFLWQLVLIEILREV